MKYTYLLIILLNISALSAQSSLLQSGPMLGYNDLREVLIWVQTTESAEVQIAYWETAKTKGTAGDKADNIAGIEADQHLGRPLRTARYTTQAEEAFTAKLLASQLSPGTTYTYELLLNGRPVALPYPTQFTTQELWQWRADTPPTFTIALGSCNYINEAETDRPGEPYGGNYDIFSRIHDKQPDAMLWLGDNTYLRETDWATQSGIYHRYTHTRSLPELQPLLASTHHYAIWDDHDFGPNDSDGSYVHKDKTLAAFTHFWGNPSFGIQRQPGTTTSFQWPDTDFFLLDNRYHRSANNRSTGTPTILGNEQLEWLLNALAGSKAAFKLVAIGGQVLNTAPVYETYSALAPAERAYLLQRIAEENITGVVFLSGDRHHSEISSYVNMNGNAVYDLTVSPLTSGSGSSRDNEVNKLRETGTLLLQRNFALLTFSGTHEERILDIELFDVEGNRLWKRRIINIPE